MKFKIPDINQYIPSEQRLEAARNRPDAKNIYMETYGCQMNAADSETVMSVMLDAGYNITEALEQADVIFINTCAVRDNAEQKIRNRLQFFNFLKKNKPITKKKAKAP